MRVSAKNFVSLCQTEGLYNMDRDVNRLKVVLAEKEIQ